MSSNCLKSTVIEAKKRKMSETEQNAGKKPKMPTETKDQEPPLRLVPVIADEYSRLIETEKMFVGKINSKKETSRLIKELSSMWPLEGRSHLKRVRWTPQKEVFEILIRSPTESEISNLPDSLSLNDVLGETHINTTGLMDTVVVYEVPKHPAMTQQQFKDSSQFWPLQFREDKYIEKILKDELFTSDERKSILTFMKMCTDAAQHGDEKVGCVIVDPSQSKVIAIGHDCRHSHPLQHAVMVAVDLVAKSQGGGCWNIDSDHVYHLPFSKPDLDLKIEELKRLNPGKDVKKLSLPYLCTSYDAYISREPCVMCAMALVHSRIRRVFYVTPTSWGALGSHCKLHILPGLNHHYEVWRIEVDTDDLSLQNSINFETCSSKS